MSPETELSSASMRAYLAEIDPPHPELAALAARTDAMAEGGMRSSLEQCRLLQILIRATGAARIVEIGCFTGVGALAMALALPEDGELITLDVNHHWAEIGRTHWRAAGIEAKIAFREGLALDGLDRLIAERGEAWADLIYVDADKKSYPAYLDRAKRIVRRGGLLALDNLFWKGAVAEPSDRSKQVEALRAVARDLSADPGYDFALLPLGDGLGVAFKK